MIIVNHRTTDCTHRLYVKFCSTRSRRYKITHTSPPEIKDQLTKKDLLTRKSKKKKYVSRPSRNQRSVNILNNTDKSVQIRTTSIYYCFDKCCVTFLRKTGCHRVAYPRDFPEEMSHH